MSESNGSQRPSPALQALAWWDRLMDAAERRGPGVVAETAYACIRESDHATLVALLTSMTMAQRDAALIAQRLASGSN